VEPRIISFRPRAGILHSLGIAYANLGQFDVARERLRLALAAADGNERRAGTVHYQLAVTYAAEENCNDAIPALEMALAKPLPPALQIDGNLLLGWCALTGYGGTSALKTARSALQRLDLRHLSSAKNGLAQSILSTPYEHR
jgi:hypothetical protein